MFTSLCAAYARTEILNACRHMRSACFRCGLGVDPERVATILCRESVYQRRELFWN